MALTDQGQRPINVALPISNLIRELTRTLTKPPPSAGLALNPPATGAPHPGDKAGVQGAPYHQRGQRPHRSYQPVGLPLFCWSSHFFNGAK